MPRRAGCSFAVRRNSSEPEKSSAAVPQCLTPEGVTPRFRCRIHAVLQCLQNQCVFLFTIHITQDIIYIYILYIVYILNKLIIAIVVDL